MKRPHLRRSFVAVAAAVLVGSVLAACGDSATEGGGNAPAATKLVVAYQTDPDSFDPPGVAGTRSRDLNFLLYEGLTTYKFDEREDGSLVWDGNEVTPALAESWDVDQDAGTVTFNLRQGVTFSASGNPFTAEDVKWSFARALVINGNNLRQIGMTDPEQMEVVDDHTIRFTLEDENGNPVILPITLPTTRFVQFLIVDSVAALEHATAADPFAEEWLKANPAGTGPYQISERTPGQEISLEAVPDHWAGPRGYDNITIRITGDSDVTALLKGGEITVAPYGITTRGFDDLENNGFTVQTGPVPRILRINVAMDNPDLEDPRVRQALALAMPYQDIIDVVFSGRAERAYSWVNAQAPDWTDAFARYDTDLEAAQALLDEAGVSGFDLNLVYDSSAYGNEDAALLIERNLQEIGVDLTLVPQDNVTFSTDQAARAAGEAVAQHNGLRLQTDGWWVDEASPGIALQLLKEGSSNWARYTNPEVEELHAAHRNLPAGEERVAAFQEIQEIVAEDAPIIPLVDTGSTVAMAPGITGFSFTPDGIARIGLLQPAE